MPVITIRWDATLDERTCPICQSLHGHHWVFDVGDTPLPDNLVHPSYGTVWNTWDGSRAHGHERFNCRCTITPDVDMSDLVAQVEQISALVRETVTYVEFTRYGRTVGAWRDVSTGQFVSGP
jgi:uncharacterized protein with gpF-like domain